MFNVPHVVWKLFNLKFCAKPKSRMGHCLPPGTQLHTQDSQESPSHYERENLYA